MKRTIIVLLIVATLGVAAIFLYRKWRAGRTTEDAPLDGSPATTLLPVFPILLVSEVKGMATITKNLGNLRVSGDQWLGKIGEYKEFESFADYAYGVRAMLKTLVTYYNKHSRRSIKDIITRYAPPAENNTQAYINNVALWTGKDPEKDLKLSDLPAVAAAMIRMETGISSTSYLNDYITAVNNYFKIV